MEETHYDWVSVIITPIPNTPVMIKDYDGNIYEHFEWDGSNWWKFTENSGGYDGYINRDVDIKLWKYIEEVDRYCSI